MPWYGGGMTAFAIVVAVAALLAVGVIIHGQRQRVQRLEERCWNMEVAVGALLSMHQGGHAHEDVMAALRRSTSASADDPKHWQVIARAAQQGVERYGSAVLINERARTQEHQETIQRLMSK